ncbi:MAG: hypothetical protein JWQ71_2965 [Pedosphaera sp.]|nr:hypothetical protein [Pedosphaera sp.]
MKGKAKNIRRILLAGVSFTFGLITAFGALPSIHSDLPNFDKRGGLSRKAALPSTNNAAALTQLKTDLPDVQVDFDETIGTPKLISSKRGFLTGPEGTGRGVPPNTLSRYSKSDPYRIPKAFLAEHSALFGHGPEILNTTRIHREFVTPHNGMRTIIWQQQVDNIPVFEAHLIAHLTKSGELVSISSHLLPAPDKAADTGNPNRAALQAKPTVSALQGVVKAAANIGDFLTEPDLTPGDGSPKDSTQHQTFKAKALKGSADVHLVWLPMNRTSMRLCHQVVLMSRARGEMFLILIDAQTGEALLRHDLTENISDASYRVFTTDSPTPFSPGHATPLTNQPPLVSRVLVVTNAFNTTASPNGWINDGDNETTGNNADAHLDRNADNLPDGQRPRGAPFRIFDFPLDFSQDTDTYADACVVNLFYWNNWMHDKLYEFGFTEAAGNFQVDNFGRGGVDSDPVEADAQDGSGFNNANFSTPPDGLSGRMQMYLFNGPTPNRDGDFDTQVILHEYAHGLSGRRVGGGVGISALVSRGLGEGWSDFYSLALLSKPGDDVNANYPEGSYASYQLFGGLGENYYYGIRRYPYSTDMAKCPGTLKDIDPGQASSHSGVPRNPVIGNSPAEIHNVGEIWCAALWDVRANLINKYGFTVGNHLVLQLVTDAMNLTPANPNFIQARDAVIQADLVDSGGVNYHELWTAFAKRGMGYYATCPSSSTTTGVVESYVVPDDLVVTPPADFSSTGAITGPFTPSAQVYTLINSGTNAISWSGTASVSWVSMSAVGGVLNAVGDSTNITVSLNAAAATLAVGTYTGTLNFTNVSTGSNLTRNITLSISPPRLYSFSLNTDPGWSREGEWSFGSPEGQGGASHGNPDPGAGATGTNVFGVNLNGDYSLAAGGPYYLTTGPLNFSGGRNVALQFKRWLNSDYPPYASATVEMSTNGIAWTTIFDNPSGEIADSSWNTFQYDISAYADNQPAIYVRWGYQVNAGAFAYSGWNIDDIDFLGISQISMSIPSSATEGNGSLSGQGHLTVAHPPTSDLTIALASSDTSKLTVPASVTILAGQTNASFSPVVVNNALLDGTKIITVTASAPGYLGSTNSISIFDNETAILTISLPASGTEGNTPLQGTIYSSAAPSADIQVSLVSGDTNSIQVPASVTILAGQTSANFDASIIDDTKINRDRNIIITAHVMNWTDGIANVLVHDNESTNLVVHLPAQAHESSGTLTNAASVAISGTLTSNLVVSLTTDATELVVPPTVTILAGQTTASFNITPVDDNQPDGVQSVIVTASAPAFASGQSAINIIDNQTPPAPINLLPPHLSTNNPMPVRLSWSPGLGEGVEYIANGGFESGNLAGWSFSPGSNGNFLNDGTVDPASPDAATLPFAGNFSALVAAQSTPDFSVMYQDLILPTNATTLTLSWVDRIRNFNTSFDTNQQFRVEVRNTNNLTLAVVFSTRPDDPLLADWTQRNFDLSNYRGQTIRLAFIVDASLDFLDVHLDEISLRAANPPVTTYDVYFGTNAIPGPGDLIGSTTNTSWLLSGVTSLTTYHWQVVARRYFQTPGPIWQFSTLPTISINDVSLVEGNSGTTNALFQVTLSEPGSDTISVDFTTLDGTAIGTEDYTPTNGTLAFLPGETNKTISIEVIGDSYNEPDETFFITLSVPMGFAVTTNSAVGTILNDDNHAPMLAPVSNQTINELTTLIITNSASDPDFPDEELTFSLNGGAPVGASIDATTGVFSWTPTETQGPGNYSITVRVTDNGTPHLSDSKTFSVTVNDVNSAPVLTAIPNQTIHAGATLSFTAIATDTDVPTNHLTFNLQPGAPTGASITTNGLFTWTSTEAQIGTNHVTVKVTDNGTPNLTDVKTFHIIVVARPTVSAISVTGANVFLEWNAIPGKVYRVQYKNTLTSPWNDLADDVTATGTLANKTDASGLAGYRFYRVILVQ